jgi:hypothetical protein
MAHRLLHRADGEAMRGMSPEDYPLHAQAQLGRSGRGRRSTVGQSKTQYGNGLGVGGNPEDFFNRPSKHSPPDIDTSSTWFYNMPSKHSDLEPDTSWMIYNDRDAPRNCIGGGDTGCCPDWAQEMGLCPPAQLVPEPMHWWANLDN